jgi:DNA-binding transcriptional regulator WhiA
MTKKQLRGNALENYKKSLKFTDTQREIIVGTLLGDASMSLRSGKPHYSIKFEQGEAHADYVNHLYDIFEPYTGTPPSWRYIDKEQTRRALWFRTYSHDDFIYYWNLFYSGTGNERKKVVSKHIDKHLTARALAYWFMDDGSKTSDSKTYHLNTQSFQKHEVKMLCDILKAKFNIIGTVNKDKDRWRIYIWRESAQAFKTLIEPYVLDCFAYRLNIL